VDGRSPGEAGYLQAALARSEAEDLLLSAAELPGFGQALTFNDLPLESQKSYGVLLLQNGDRNTIFSSFSAANPGGETQMVRLGSDPNSFALGIEDVAVTSGRSDRDFNDTIVSITGVSLWIRPNAGIGKLEPLRQTLSGCPSRRNDAVLSERLLLVVAVGKRVRTAADHQADQR
jgi:Txe/YoeB family toxin of Txe-Axe toxin-antitoxin module